MPNFFSIYDDFTKESEPPPAYHAWSAVAALSALLGKKAYVPQGHFTVHPNLYIVLVGDAGMRKTTAMSVAKRLVRLLETVPVAPESSTREALIDIMSENKVTAHAHGKEVSYWQASAFVSELQEFLGGKHINQAMVGFLTAIWDESEFKEKTRNGGTKIIPNPYFTMLGCCTTDWMSTKLKQDVISDGFSRRTIFCLADEINKPNPWPVSAANETEMLLALTNQAKRVHSLSGRFKVTKPALDYYCERYLTMRSDGLKHSAKVQNYFSSKHVLALKLAMCISSGVSSNCIIDSAQMKLAFDFLANSEAALDRVFSGVGRNELKAYKDKVLRAIAEDEKGLDKRALVRKFYDDMDGQELDEIIKALVEAGEITIKVGPSVTSMPIFSATELTAKLPSSNLLGRARLLSPLDERVAEESSIEQGEYRLAPATEQLLARQADLRKQQASGLLMKGTRSLSQHKDQTRED